MWGFGHCPIDLDRIIAAQTSAAAKRPAIERSSEAQQQTPQPDSAPYPAEIITTKEVQHHA
ncbi:hypothetical protein [Chitinibacter sp. GC72]|uniref:hypothetical protein n=1 Tax=Chitinibacter sp. GC72 TaxID=1526917 RepID=UPI0012FB96B5|nr:hypothetical protein [Chitinibacter sp. GC72]